MAQINGNDIHDMVGHWLKTPVCGYLGSDYGQDIKSLLQRPHSDGAAESFLGKLRDDVAALQSIPVNAVNLYAIPAAPDRLDLVIEVAGKAINVPAGE